MDNEIYHWLMDQRNAGEGWMESRLFAMMIAFRSTSAYWSLTDMLGLTEADMEALMGRYFPFAIQPFPLKEANPNEAACYKIEFHSAVKKSFVCHCCGWAVTPEGRTKRVDVPIFNGFPTAVNRQIEVDDLKNLLLSHRTSNFPEASWVAGMIAVGALGEDHLWKDLGLSGRDDVSFILKTYFTTLFSKNTGDMKWKKFFYKQLCDLDDIKVCKAPSCSVCTHYWNCFGLEEDGQHAA